MADTQATYYERESLRILSENNSYLKANNSLLITIDEKLRKIIGNTNIR